MGIKRVSSNSFSSKDISRPKRSVLCAKDRQEIMNANQNLAKKDDKFCGIFTTFDSQLKQKEVLSCSLEYSLSSLFVLHQQSAQTTPFPVSSSLLSGRPFHTSLYPSKHIAAIGLILCDRARHSSTYPDKIAPLMGGSFLTCGGSQVAHMRGPLGRSMSILYNEVSNPLDNVGGGTENQSNHASFWTIMLSKEY